MTSKSMTYEIPKNLKNEIQKIYYFELKSKDSSQWRRICPFCQNGILLVRRSPKTFIIEPTDQCIDCGQRVEYIDIEKMREKEKS